MPHSLAQVAALCYVYSLTSPKSILRMARAYAEAGGRGGPEMQDYEAAAEIIGED